MFYFVKTCFMSKLKLSCGFTAFSRQSSFQWKQKRIKHDVMGQLRRDASARPTSYLAHLVKGQHTLGLWYMTLKDYNTMAYLVFLQDHRIGPAAKPQFDPLKGPEIHGPVEMVWRNRFWAIKHLLLWIKKTLFKFKPTSDDHEHSQRKSGENYISSSLNPKNTQNPEEQNVSWIMVLKLSTDSVVHSLM